LRRVSITDRHGGVMDAVPSDAEFLVRIEYTVTSPIENVRVGFRLHTNDGTLVFTTGDTDPAGTGAPRRPGTHTSICTIPGNLLNEGHYYVTVACDQPGHEILFVHEHVVTFTIYMTGGAGAAVRDGRLGVIRPALGWSMLPPMSDAPASHMASSMRDA
ncbi:MAG: Wzt carbohydrate-binding domain-containing protein, partial [Armatimonadota bacterium]|nr:Wzt carbohydrate-binding domain-containing protein [Armatimonadota bacterium]